MAVIQPEQIRTEIFGIYGTRKEGRKADRQIAFFKISTCPSPLVNETERFKTSLYTIHYWIIPTTIRRRDNIRWLWKWIKPIMAAEEKLMAATEKRVYTRFGWTPNKSKQDQPNWKSVWSNWKWAKWSNVALTIQLHIPIGPLTNKLKRRRKGKGLTSPLFNYREQFIQQYQPGMIT